MNVATAVAVSVGTVAIAAFIPMAIHGSGTGNPPSWVLILMGVFGLAAVILLGVGFVFWEDMSRIGLTRDERLRWQAGYVSFPPVAAFAYWWVHVRPLRNDESSEQPSR